METGQSRDAFVIRLRAHSDIQAGRLEGTVEHIDSYKAARFRSVGELLAFIAGIVAERTHLDRS